MALVSTAS